MSAQNDNPKPKRSRRKISWAAQITVYTFFIAIGLTVCSNVLLERLNMAWAFFILVVIIAIGVATDILGVAVTSAREGPFLARASKKLPGAKSAIWLVRNAERVSNFCNDVIGDICGIVSGGTGAAIVGVLVVRFHGFDNPEVWVSTILSALIAAATVGGKAMGKRYAIKNCIPIVQAMGKAMESLGIRSGTGK
ncbi:MAG: hypothetical protein PHO66_03620 [Eubacteriales bacterium]|nr:hypothetical protein [Eubacteriales bacterium]